MNNITPQQEVAAGILAGGGACLNLILEPIWNNPQNQLQPEYDETMYDVAL